MILERSVSFEIREDAGSEGDGFTLVGHAAVFNQETEINSWEGNFIEDIAPGAFRKTIRERTPVLQFDHGRHPLIGSIPIGTISSLSEDPEGLAVEARISDNWLIEPVRMAIKERSVNGMSFRFEVLREEWRDNTGKLVKNEELQQLLWSPGERGPLKRTLKELKVPELGPVVFPAYAGTSVDVRCRNAADKLLKDSAAVHFMRSSLVQGNAKIDDPIFRDDLPEIAKALLFRDIGIHEDDEDKAEIGRKFIEAFKEREDAPVSNHPSDREVNTEDAPVRDDHSSNNESAVTLDLTTVHYRARKMNRILASISEDKYDG